MTILAAYISQTPAKIAAMSRASLSEPAVAGIRSMDVVRSLEERTADLLKGVKQIADEIPTRRPHSDAVMFSPEQRARNIVMTYLAAVSEARRGDLRSLDGQLVEMKSRMPVTRDVGDAVSALNARRGLLHLATDELEKLVASVARDDLSAAEGHRVRIGEIAGASIAPPQREMTTFEYLMQRSRSMSNP